MGNTVLHELVLNILMLLLPAALTWLVYWVTRLLKMVVGEKWTKKIVASVEESFDSGAGEQKFSEATAFLEDKIGGRFGFTSDEITHLIQAAVNDLNTMDVYTTQPSPQSTIPVGTTEATISGVLTISDPDSKNIIINAIKNRDIDGSV